MQLIEKLRVFLRGLLEIGLLLMAVGILLGVAVGTEVPFLGSNVVANLNNFLSGLGSNAVPALIALVVIAWLYSREDSMLRRTGRGSSRARRKAG
jgi:hypothetical protein